MTIGYAIISHQDPLQVRRLVEALLESPTTAGVALHHDAASGPIDLGPVDPERFAFVDPAVAVTWGDWSLVDAALLALELSLHRFPSARWIALLSGQDYPARALENLPDHLDRADSDIIADASPVVERWGLEHATWRYGYSYHQVPRFLIPKSLYPGVTDRWFVGHVGPLAWSFVPPPRGQQLLGIRRRDSSHLELYGGSGWFTATRPAVEHLVTVYRDGALRRRLARTRVPDEAFAPTVFAQHHLGMRRDDTRYIDFAPGAASPKLLGIDDVTAIESSGAFFVRKVSSSYSAQLLDALDRRRGLGG